MNIPRKTFLLTVIAASLGFAIVQIDIMIVNVALAEIESSLHADIFTLQWIVDAYTLFFASLLMSSGMLGDRLGPRRIFLWGLWIFTVASFTCSIAQTSFQLIISRALQGIGAALIIPNSLSLLKHISSEDDSVLARTLGLWSVAGGLATAIGPIIGGVLVYLAGWRSIFLVNLPICFLGIWMTRCCQQDKKVPSLPLYRLIDLPGQLLIIVTLILLISSIIAAGARGWSDAQVIIGFILTLISGSVFIWMWIKNTYSMMPLKFFKSSRFSAAVTTGFLNNLTYYGLIFILSLFFQNFLHYSPVKAGLVFISLAGASISNLIGSRMAARSGPRRPMVLGFLIATIGYISFYDLNQKTEFLMILLQLMITTFGLGFVIPPMTTALLSTVDKAHSGTASAMLSTMRQTGGAIGIALFGSFVSNCFSTNTWKIQMAFMICACLTFVAAGVSAIWIGKEIGESTVSE